MQRAATAPIAVIRGARQSIAHEAYSGHWRRHRRGGRVAIVSGVEPAEKCTLELVRWFVGTGIKYSMISGEVYTTSEVEGIAVWFKPGHSGLNLWGLLRSGMFVVPSSKGEPFAEIDKIDNDNKSLSSSLQPTKKDKHNTI